jgi:hypothetical protein
MANLSSIYILILSVKRFSFSFFRLSNLESANFARYPPERTSLFRFSSLLTVDSLIPMVSAIFRWEYLLPKINSKFSSLLLNIETNFQNHIPSFLYLNTTILFAKCIF